MHVLLIKKPNLCSVFDRAYRSVIAVREKRINVTVAVFVHFPKECLASYMHPCSSETLSTAKARLCSTVSEAPRS